MAVSLALRGRPGVSKAVAERIRQVAERMGYVPNPLLSTLMTCRRSGGTPGDGLTLAYLGFSGRDAAARYRKGAGAAAKALGYRIDDFKEADYPTGRLPVILRTRGIPGVLLGPGSGLGEGSVRHELYAEFPVVQIGRSRRDPNHDRVTTDNFTNMLRCVRALQASGVQRIVYLDAVSHDSRSESRWKAAYLTAMEEAGTALPVRLINDLNIPRPLGPNFQKKFIAEVLSELRPEGVVSARPAVGEDLRKLAGCRVAFACAARDGAPEWISGIDVDHEMIGAEAVRMLATKVQGPQGAALPQRTSSTVALQGRWHQGESHLFHQ